MTCDTSSSGCGLEKLESLSDDSITVISENWNGFCSSSEALLKGSGDLSFSDEFVMRAKNLCKHGLSSLVEQHFLRCIEVCSIFLHHSVILFSMKCSSTESRLIY